MCPDLEYSPSKVELVGRWFQGDTEWGTLTFLQSHENLGLSPVTVAQMRELSVSASEMRLFMSSQGKGQKFYICFIKLATIYEGRVFT